MSSSKIHLAYKEFSPENPPVIFLHGLTSAKETWDECAKTIANRTGSKVYCYDARNHGDSEWSETNTYYTMTNDLLDFMDSMNIPKAILVGHSMGGKTSMAFALRFPGKVHSLIIEDISLTTTPEAREFVFWYIDRLRKFLKEIPPNTELKEAKRIAASYLTGQNISQIKQEDITLGRKILDGSELPLKYTRSRGFEWKTNLEGIEYTMRNNLSGLDIDGVYEGRVLSLYGTKSPFKVMDGKDLMLKHFPNTIYAPIEGRSHSLHVDYSDSFKDLVCDFILKHRK